MAHLWAKWLRHPCRLGDPHRFRAGGGGSKVAHLWAKWLRHPCRLGDPHRCRAGGKIRSGPLVGKVAMSPLPSRGSPPLQSGGEIRSGPLVGKVATSPLPSRGSPLLQSGGGNQKWPTYGQSGYVTPAVSGIPTDAERGAKSEVAHLWAKWLCHPCSLGDPQRFKAGGKIRSGPLVGKVATSPLPSRGSPPLHSRGGNQKWPTYGQSGYVTPAVSGIPTASERGGGDQKWPTCGQSGYVTPAVSGIPTAAERGAKSEVAHLWAKWLRHPCRPGDPHRFRAGEEIRSGPLVGKVATSPLPSQGSPPLQSGGQNQKWPTYGQSGYVTPAVSGIPTASKRGGKSEVAHLWAKWLRHSCRLGDPHRCIAGGEIRSGPLVGKVATSLLPSRGSPPLQQRGGGEIRSGPLVGKVATSPLPSRGSPPLQSGGGGDQKWPTCGQSGYVTPAVSGIPTAAERGAKSEVAHLWAKWLCHPCRPGDPHRCRAGGKSEVAHLWAKWLRHPCRLGDPHCCRAGGEIRSGPLMGKVATSPLPSRGSPPLQSGGQNQKWPTCGQSGYVGIPTASERGRKSEVAHLWAKWLRHPCRLRDPRRFRAGGKIRSGPLMGKVATSPLPSRGSQPLQSGGQNQKWPTYGQSGYVTPAVSGIPSASKRGAKSEVAHLWAKWLRHPCRLGDPHRCIAGGEIRSGPLMDKVATSPLPSRGSPPLQSGGGGDQKWPTCGQSGYVTPAVSGIPTAAERGAKSEVAHLWAKWLRHPCRPGDPHRFRAGEEIRSGPLVGKVATPPLPSQGSPLLQSGGQNQKWPTYGQSGYVTPAASGIPTAAERGAKSEVAHLWAKWLRHPCRPGDPHRFRAGEEIRSGPLVGKVATSPLPSQGSPPLQSGGQNQKWPTYGQSGYVTPAVSGIPTASERGAKSEVAHLWAKWLRHPCRLGDPHRCTAGGKIRSGPLVGKVATSPLPSRGSPPLQSGGQNQKWPTCGQSGYLTPAVSGSVLQSGGGNQKWPTCGQSGYLTPAVLGIPTASERGGESEVAHLWAKWLRHPCRLGVRASERGGKSEVAHLWAKWLPHPCRLGDPHRFRAGGEIRSGPLVGKVALFY